LQEFLFLGLVLRDSTIARLILPAADPRLCRASVFKSRREKAMREPRAWGVRIVLLCAALAVMALSTRSASAQTFRGTILGTVTDTSGASVSGAAVTVHNVDTGVDRTTETTTDGGYLVPELPIGMYDVTIKKDGFQKSVTTGVRVDVSVERRVDAVLKAGAVAERVVVSGEELPQVETTSDTLGGVLTQDNVKDLPINGRDYTKLIFLTPGIAGSPDQITDSPGSFGVFSMNGARGRSNNFLLDGTDMNDGYRNDPAINEAGVFGTPATILPIDAVSELNVLSNYQPEYGRNAGAVVNIVTKSGTNAFHGNGFDYFRNDALDARNFFDPVGTPKAVFHNNQFGGSLGGPIVKDKTFFFVDYEGQREGVGVVTLACVPEPNRIAFDGGATNPVIAALLARNPWPAPNLGTRPVPGDTDFAGFETGCPRGPNASLTAPSFNNLSSMIAKIDHNFNRNNIVTGRYFFGDSTQQFPLALNATGGQLPGFDTVTPTRVQLVSLSYVHVFSPTKVNDLRYGWNRFAEGFFPQDASFDPNSIGLCNTPEGSATCSSSGLPIILVSPQPNGGSAFFAQPGATSGDPRRRVDTNNQLIDSFSSKINRHDLKFGAEFRRTSIQQHFDKYSRGRIKFPTLADFLQGDPSSGFSYIGNTLRHSHENNYGLYIQDSYHVSPRVTLNYGLRWDYYGVVAEKDHLFSNFDTTTSQLVRVGPGGLSKLYKPDYKNFAPRISAAWDVFGTSKTVVRAGFGIFFDAFSQDMMLGHLPYPTFYSPGPAYNNIAPDPVQQALFVGGAITPGVHIYGTPSCGTDAGGNFHECDIFGFDRNIKTPYLENYNLNIQQQISRNVVLQVGYVGSQGHRLFRFFDINQPSAAQVFAADCPNTPLSQIGQPCTADPGAAIQDFTVPRRFPNAPDGTFYIFQENSTGKSNYNSLQLSLRVNRWHGFNSVVNYVWSRSIDNSSDGEDFVVNAAQPQDSNNPNAEKGPSNFNIPQRFTWIAGYELPTIGGGWQKLKNGWGLDSAVTIQSGQPFTLNYNGVDDYSGGADIFDRPDVVGPIVYNYHDPNNFLQLSSFAMPCTISAAAQTAGISGFASDCEPGTRHYGTLGRNALQGPPFKQWDLAIYKNTSITERLKLQLRAEFFNILNHPNFASPLLPAFIADPASNINSACGCGFSSTVVNNREVGNGNYHLVATGDVGIGNPFLGGGGPRGIQLAAKFMF
jgi:outer membrane receptor protein involved in Fe transport